MEQLKDDKAILNLIGKNNVLAFRYACEGILTYSTLIPKDVRDEPLYFEVEVFYTTANTFFDFETLEDLIHKKRVFRVTAKDIGGDREQIYCRPLNEN